MFPICSNEDQTRTLLDKELTRNMMIEVFFTDIDFLAVNIATVKTVRHLLSHLSYIIIRKTKNAADLTE